MVISLSENFNETCSIYSNNFAAESMHECCQWWRTSILTSADNLFPLPAVSAYIGHAQALLKSCPKKVRLKTVLCNSLYANFILFICLLNRKQMDKLKTVRSQELTHPLEYNRDQIHPLQEAKISHSKFKGTARVTGENMKSEEIQVSCLL